MSNKALRDVFANSTAEGRTFMVHVAIADTVNARHGHRFWMSVENLAAKSRASRGSVITALQWLVEHGYLVVVARPKNKPVEYRFLFSTTIEDDHEEVQQPDPGCPTIEPEGFNGWTQTQKNPIEPKNPKRAARRTKTAPQPAATPQPDKPAAPHLELLPPPPPNPAHTLCRHVWDHKTPKPATPFIAAVKIAERLIGAGHDPDAVRDAMIQAPTLTTSSIEIALARHRPTTPSIEDSWDRSQPSGEIVW